MIFIGFKIVFWVSLSFWLLRVYGAYVVRLTDLIFAAHYSYLDGNTEEEVVAELRKTIARCPFYAGLTKEELERAFKFSNFLRKFVGKPKTSFWKPIMLSIVLNALMIFVAVFFSFFWFLFGLNATVESGMPSMVYVLEFITLFQLFYSAVRVKRFFETKLLT